MEIDAFIVVLGCVVFSFVVTALVLFRSGRRGASVQRVCPACQAENPAAARHCRRCGALL